MEVTAKALRGRVGELLACVDRGERVVISYRGKPRAVLVPVHEGSRPVETATALPGFGMWKDRADMGDVDGYVRNLRRPRDAV